MTINLWSFDLLKRAGFQFNRDLLFAFKNYLNAGANPQPATLLSSAAFCALFLANLNPDTRKRDLMIKLLSEGPIEDPLTYKKLMVMKWTPVKRTLTAYSTLDGSDYAPNLARLLELQVIRHADMAPSWATLMPDKIYALHQFEGFPAHSFDKMLQPFGKATQVAFAAYTGVDINGQPKMIHHEYLRNFSASIAHATGEPETPSLHIASGLHVFGETLLQN